MVKNPPANIGDTGPIPGSGRSPGGGNGNPLQYSCLENPTDRGVWQIIVHGVAKELDRTMLMSTHRRWYLGSRDVEGVDSVSPGHPGFCYSPSSSLFKLLALVT